jgi:hypothetical protein
MINNKTSKKDFQFDSLEAGFKHARACAKNQMAATSPARQLCTSSPAAAFVQAGFESLIPPLECILIQPV